MSAWFRTPLGILACPPRGGYTSLDSCLIVDQRGGRKFGQLESLHTQVTLISRDPWQRWLSGVYWFRTHKVSDIVVAAIPADVITEFKTRPITSSYFRDFSYHITRPLEMYGQGNPYVETDQHYTSASRYLQDCGFDKPDSVIRLEHTQCYLQQFSIDYKTENVVDRYQGTTKQAFAQQARDTYGIMQKLWEDDFRWRKQAVGRI